MMDPKIMITGIESPKLKQQVQALMEDLIPVLPSDSAVRATFSFIQNQFLAEVKVASESAYMTAIDQAEVLADALEHVRIKIMNQVVAWRRQRFAC